jgi:GNAT superfamily N-acetyltransferase
MPIEITPVSGMEQLERWVAIQNEVSPDDPEDASMMALIRAQEPDHVDFLASVEGEPVGAAMFSDSQSTGRPWFEISVPVRHRGQGIGGALFEAVSTLARDRFATGLACEVRGDDAYSRAFAERRGFTEDARLTQCTLDLTTELPLPPVPDGVELEWLAQRPSLLQDMHAVAVRTYPELLGYRALLAESFVDWQVYELGNPRMRLELIPVALAGTAVVGFATMQLYVDETCAEVRTIVVVPEWRGRGVATALLGALLTRARATGIRRAAVWVDARRPIELFGRLGFRATGECVVLETDL